MNHRKAITILIVVQIVILCLCIKIAFLSIEAYRGLRPALTVGQKGLADNLTLHALLLNVLKTRRYSSLKGYLTPQCQQKMSTFIQDWENAVHMYGQVRAFEQSTGSLEYSQGGDQSCIISRWRCRIHLERGTVIVQWTQIYRQGRWLIDAVVVQQEP